MGCILYIFPHPDDESFGPAPAIAVARRQGHEVHLLTLTHGEATKERELIGCSLEEMGQIRRREMACMADVLDLTSLSVLAYPDGGFAELDPLELEEVIAGHIDEVKPDVVVTYAIHGISGHPDHLVTHAVVKRIFAAARKEGRRYPRRLALFTLRDEPTAGRQPHLKGSSREAIDVVVPYLEEDLRRAQRALDCYETYQRQIKLHDPLGQVKEGVCFELFGEQFDPPLSDLFDRLESTEERGPVVAR